MPVCLLFEEEVCLVVGDPLVIFAHVGEPLERAGATKSYEPVGIIEQSGEATLCLCGAGK